ncbi:hypothetical protein VOM14_01250 [Paraburkholderia sp. MPAMCS5]|nr:hypothetical protein [Paraburkholderia sp. MPAMCS5]
MEDFDDAFKALIGSEGGYSFNPADPGCRAARRRFSSRLRPARRGRFSRALPESFFEPLPEEWLIGLHTRRNQELATCVVCCDAGLSPQRVLRYVCNA